MAWTLPTLPLTKDANNTPYLAVLDNNNQLAIPTGQYYKSPTGLWIPVSDTTPLPIRSTANNILDGELNITSAGTPQRISTDQSCKSVLIRAKTTNTEDILIGDITPTFPLPPGSSIILDVKNFNLLYIDATVSGEGIDYIAEI